jgi:hypothetical protein
MMLQISMKIGGTSTRRQKKGSSCRVTVRAVCTLAREYDGGGGYDVLVFLRIWCPNKINLLSNIIFFRNISINTDTHTRTHILLLLVFLKD